MQESGRKERLQAMTVHQGHAKYHHAAQRKTWLTKSPNTKPDRRADALGRLAVGVQRSAYCFGPCGRNSPVPCTVRHPPCRVALGSNLGQICRAATHRAGTGRFAGAFRLPCGELAGTHGNAAGSEGIRPLSDEDHPGTVGPSVPPQDDASRLDIWGYRARDVAELDLATRLVGNRPWEAPVSYAGRAPLRAAGFGGLPHAPRLRGVASQPGARVLYGCKMPSTANSGYWAST